MYLSPPSCCQEVLPEGWVQNNSVNTRSAFKGLGCCAHRNSRGPHSREAESKALSRIFVLTSRSESRTNRVNGPNRPEQLTAECKGSRFYPPLTAEQNSLILAVPAQLSVRMKPRKAESQTKAQHGAQESHHHGHSRLRNNPGCP